MTLSSRRISELRDPLPDVRDGCDSRTVAGLEDPEGCVWDRVMRAGLSPLPAAVLRSGETPVVRRFSEIRS